MYQKVRHAFKKCLHVLHNAQCVFRYFFDMYRKIKTYETKRKTTKKKEEDKEKGKNKDFFRKPDAYAIMENQIPWKRTKPRSKNN